MTKLAGPPLGNAFRWALEASTDPARAMADWLAGDIDPARPTALALLADPSTSVATLRQAKSVYKTMRIVGETVAARRLAARLYLAAIAAALVRHGERISGQSDAALQRALTSLLDDTEMPDPLRDLAGTALCVLRERKSA